MSYTLTTLLAIIIFYILNHISPGKGLALDEIAPKSIFDNAYDYIKDKGYIVEEIIETIQLNDDLDEKVVDSLSGFYDLAVLLDDIDDDNSTSSATCTRCRALMTSLKALVAASDDWDSVRDGVVEACFGLFENATDVRADVLCPGMVDTQGPHLYEVLLTKHRKSPEDICRNLNACFPSEESRTLHEAMVISKLKDVKKRQPQIHNKSLAQRKQEAMVVVQLTDIHIEPRYQQGTETDCGLPVCCIPVYGNGDAGFHGDLQCNIPQSTMELFISKAAELQPAFIIYSGDTPPHSMWDETYESQLDCTARLVDALTRILGDIPVYPNIGNHEMYPTNMYSMEFLGNYTEPMNRDFASWWASLAGFTEENIETMETGGYYSLVARPGLRIISINTNYWYTFNWYSVLHEGGEELQTMLDFIRASLEEARQNDEKVVIITHHPPCNWDQIVTYTWMFEELMVEYGDLVTMHVSGHSHNDEFRVFSIDDLAISVMWAAPPVTSLLKDPSMRVFYIDSETLEVIDYERHGFDLANSINNPDNPEIVLMYSAMEEYGLADMSANSWMELINRMATDDVTLQTYYKNYLARPSNDTCDEECRVVQVCQSQFYSYNDYTDCVEETSQILL